MNENMVAFLQFLGRECSTSYSNSNYPVYVAYSVFAFGLSIAFSLGVATCLSVIWVLQGGG